jgi:1-acyl-sn-glycerol-3-phosphate acyltransferase
MTNLFRVLRVIYEYLVLYTALLCFAVFGVLFTILCAVLYVLLPRKTGIWFGRNAIGWLFRSYLALLCGTGLLKLDLSEFDKLRREKGLIVAPNHPSLLDAVFVISRLPDIACIMKSGIRDNVVLGGGARLAGYIRNDTTAEMVREAARVLRSGQTLLVFPEGTRTRSGPVNPFRGGFALIAKRARAPVQTVFIETNSRFLGKGWPILKKPQLPLVYRARLGKRFEVDGDVKSFVARLESYFRNSLEAGPDAGTSAQAAAAEVGDSATAS